MKRAYSIRSLANEWGCSEGVIRKAIADGRIRHFRVGTLIRITADEVQSKTLVFAQGAAAEERQLAPAESSALPHEHAGARPHVDSRLPNWPGAMRLRLAAAYCDMPVTQFEREVAAGVLPEPIQLGRGKRWARASLDQAIVALSGAEADWRAGSPLYGDARASAKRRPNMADKLYGPGSWLHGGR